MRIITLGDEIAAGCGDPRVLGWVGRVLARTQLPPATTCMNLGIPGETLAKMGNRWEREIASRVDPHDDNRLLIGIGIWEAASGVSSARSRLSLANILDAAGKYATSALVVGPPPLTGADPERIEALSRACADVCGRRHVPFVETYAPLARHDQWLADIRDYGIPGQAGYGLLAWLVLQQGWYQWIGCPES